MKAIIVLLAAFSATAMADMSRPINTNDLVCWGQTKDGTTAAVLQVSATENKTAISVSMSDNRTIELGKDEALTVGDEGNVYIQQVSNEGGYNLYLSGADLNSLLTTKECKLVTLTGTLDLFKEGKTFDLQCQGSLY